MPQDEVSGPDQDTPPPDGTTHTDEEVDFAAYVFPDTRQRRYTAVILWVLAACGFGVYASTGGDGLITYGAVVGGIVLAVAGFWFWFAGWRMRLDQESALIEATRQVSFGVGHAAANLGWRGVRSRPTWRILLYSAEDPPAMRGFVELDAIDGAVFEVVEEPNPEDWDKLRRDEGAGEA